MALSKSDVRPSCRKNSRCPSPHSGAVRNSSGPALPWETPSAKPEPMLCTNRSENKLASILLNAGTYDAPVFMLVVWQAAHFTTSVKRCLPFWIDGEHPLPVHAGVG